jgi:hypothetical protein
VTTLAQRDCRTCGGSFSPAHSSSRFCASCGTCSAPGCDRARDAGGLCLMHYRRLQKHGDLNFGRTEMHARGFPERRARRPHVDLLCKNCGADFRIAASLSERDGISRKFCSRICALAAQDKKPSFECAHCGDVTSRRKNAQSQGYNYKQRFCSRDCANSAQRVGFVDKNGYRVVTVDGAQCFEHRVVVESRLGRKLSAHETVHHVNGNRLDNRDENLELWSSRHGRGQRVEDKIGFCKSFLTEYGVSHQVHSSTETISGFLGFGS